MLGRNRLKAVDRPLARSAENGRSLARATWKNTITDMKLTNRREEAVRRDTKIVAGTDRMNNFHCGSWQWASEVVIVNERGKPGRNAMLDMPFRTDAVKFRCSPIRVKRPQPPPLLVIMPE
jgi:hypothetical protein